MTILPDPRELAAAVRAGDRQALARSITLLESTRADHRDRAEAFLDLITPHAGTSIRIGISGVPGVGKSTFIETFGNFLIDEGRQVAVLTVDPSSALSGGSILGDKTRMDRLGRRREAFIRPSPSGGTLGGVARRTAEALLACEAAGFDVVIVETVGVGQSETAVSEMTDIFLLLLTPAGGDELQGIKRGIVELADLVLVNKADGELKNAADRAAASYRSGLALLRPRSALWKVPVLTCSSLKGEGIGKVWETILRYQDVLSEGGEIIARRSLQGRERMWSETAESLMFLLKENSSVRRLAPELEKAVAAGKISSSGAARRLIDSFCSSEKPIRLSGEIGALNHVAIAVPDLKEAVEKWQNFLGAEVSSPVELQEHGVTAVFAQLPNTHFELLEPLGDNSPIRRFLERSPAGGIHHVSFEVKNLDGAAARLSSAGFRLLGGGKTKIGAHGKPVLFLHPGDFGGVLVELMETD